jgi:quinone-modifying oxidoreductase, subunit QmoC
MTVRVDPQFLTKIKKYGALNVEKCFNCGNCTAICPLSTDTETFPRRLIHYAQLGLNEPLLRSKELWLCYYCGECTQTCPQKADPGEFMATARRYAIASYDPLGLARLLFTSPALSVFLLVLLYFLIALVFYTFHGVMPADVLRLFDFIPAGVIHNLGITALVILAITGLAGAVNMFLKVRRGNTLLTTPGVRLNWLGAVWETIVFEVLSQRRYRQDCKTGADQRPWFLQKWFVHASTMWGFLGLFAATALNYGLELFGFKPTGTWVPLWYPVRLLGTVAGMFLVYGTSLAILNRLRKVDESTSHSSVSDWALLILLWLTGVSGFALEIAVYLPHAEIWAYWTLLGHIAGAVELILLAPFTKFAHVLYRTMAVYLHTLRQLPVTKKAEAGTD